MRSEIEHGLERQADAYYSPVASVRGRDAGLEHPVPIQSFPKVFALKTPDLGRF